MQQQYSRITDGISSGEEWLTTLQHNYNCTGEREASESRVAKCHAEKREFLIKSISQKGRAEESAVAAASLHYVELTFAHVSISCDGAPLPGLLARAPRRQAHQAHAVLQLCNGRKPDDIACSLRLDGYRKPFLNGQNAVLGGGEPQLTYYEPASPSSLSSAMSLSRV